VIVPRFTVRRLLAVTALAAIAFAIVSAAYRGLQSEAIGNDASPYSTQIDERAQNPVYALAAVSIGMGAIVATAIVYVAFFALAFLAAEVAAAIHPKPVAKSPFAQHTPAPQLLPPEEPT
jgi:archaellum biogenesis protein FlaJ (TadC family)